MQAGARQKTLKPFEDDKDFNWKLKQLRIIMLIPNLRYRMIFIAYHEVYFIIIVPLVFPLLYFMDAVNSHLAAEK